MNARYGSHNAGSVNTYRMDARDSGGDGKAAIDGGARSGHIENAPPFGLSARLADRRIGVGDAELLAACMDGGNAPMPLA